MGAVQRWRELVEAEHAQSDRMRQEAPPDDHWRPYVEQFRADPRRQDDPLLNMLLDKVMPHHTVIDVGAGAGQARYTPRPPVPSPGSCGAFPEHGLCSSRGSV